MTPNEIREIIARAYLRHRFGVGGVRPAHDTTLTKVRECNYNSENYTDAHDRALLRGDRTRTGRSRS